MQRLMIFALAGLVLVLLATSIYVFGGFGLRNDQEIVWQLQGDAVFSPTDQPFAIGYLSFVTDPSNDTLVARYQGKPIYLLCIEGCSLSKFKDGYLLEVPAK